MTITTDGRIHLKAHPAAALFPMMSADELTELRINILERKKAGLDPLTDDIVLTAPADQGGEVLDGRNRLMACNMVGVTPTFCVYEGDDPIGFVISKNIHRRHLTPSQRAAIAAELMPMLEAAAAERRKNAADAGRATRWAAHDSAGVAEILGTSAEPDVAPLEGEDLAAEGEDAAADAAGDTEASGDAAPAPAAPGGKKPIRARDQAAKVMNVSPRSVESAKKVREEGAPELLDAVKRGAVPVSTAETLTQLPKDQQAAVVAQGDKAVLAEAARIRAEKEAQRRTEREAQIAEQAAGAKPLEGTGGKLFGLALIDPPWRYNAPTSDSRRIENHYPTMSIEELCALPVPSILTTDAIVFMWVTAPFDCSGEAQRLVEAWGLKLVSKTIWVKDSEEAVTERGEASRAGMGRWQRVDHELLYWCVRGTPPTPAAPARPSSVIYRPRGKHSEKPDVVAAMIERLYPLLPRVELFARAPRLGWEVWGNESQGRVGEAAATETATIEAA